MRVTGFIRAAEMRRVQSGLTAITVGTIAAASFAVQPVPAGNVRLLDGPFKERQDVLRAYLLEVEPNRLLAGFREQAGLPAKAKRYGGWEAKDINGHSLGHYLSAVAWMGMRDRVDYIVDELAACQRANGDGYVLPLSKKCFEELRAGKVNANGFNLNGAWVPFYTLHKVLAGLRDANTPKALEVARGIVRWLDGVLSGLSDAQIQDMLRCEYGGMNEVLADLGYPELAAKYFHHRAVFEPLMRGEDRLNGLHANTQVPKIVGLAREYELTGKPEYRYAVETFWSNVVHRRSFCNGGHGEREHFFPVDQFPRKLTPHTAETCNTYNMIKLAGHLFAWRPDSEYMDFVERGLINHLAANIGRRPGEFGYFLGLGSVGVKVYSTPFNSWWCCVGSGMESPARYQELIYYHDRTTLYVNLFMASEVTWNGITVRQETRFPEEDRVRFTIRCRKPVRFRLKLRQPSWCEKIETTFDQVWKDGDTVDVRLPMTLRFEPLPNSGGNIVAAMYGPMVLAGIVPGQPAKERFSDHLKARGKTDDLPPMLIRQELQPTGRFAEFRSEGAVKPDDLVFVPFYRVYEEPYAVYFPMLSPEEWAKREDELRAEKERLARMERATLDTVDPGFQQSEVEHNVRGERSQTGDFQNRKWRDARDGWFSYEMAVDPARAVALVITYWGGDRGERDFDILVDGGKIAAEQLRANKPGQFYDVIYAIPAEATKDKTSVSVRFQAHAGKVAGGVYGMRMILSSP